MIQPKLRAGAKPDSRDVDRARCLLLAIIGLGTALAVFVVTPAFVVDDCFICFRYARNLFDGHGVVFNPGERVEGYTTFSHVVLPWLALVLRLPPIDFMQVIGLAAQAITAWLTWRIGIRLGRTPGQALIAPLLLATHLSPMAYAMSGMSMPLFAMLVTLAVHLIQGGLGSHRASALLGITLAGLTLTRFDGFVLAAVLLAFVVVFDRRLLSIWPGLTILAGVMLVYNLWRIWYYPTLLPNTYYAKMGFSLRQLLLGKAYLLGFLASGYGLFILGVVPFVLARPGRGLRLLGLLITAQLGYVMIVGGDWMPFWRFVLPVLPVLMVTVQEGFWTLIGLARPMLSSRRTQRVLGVATLVGLFATNLTPLRAALDRERTRPITHRIASSLQGRFWQSRDCVAIGENIDERFPEDWLVAIEWAGILPYYFRQPVVDMFGLVDPEAIHMGFPTTAHGLHLSAAYITGKKPAVIVVVARLYSTPAEAREAITRRMTEKRGPAWVHALYGPLTSPPHDYQVAIEQIGHRYWPVLLRQDLELPPRGQ